jgi:hypothetical protein
MGVTILEITSANLMEFKSEVGSVYVTRPLLADVNEPVTARFYTAYAEAQALHTEMAPTDDEQIAHSSPPLPRQLAHSGSPTKTPASHDRERSTYVSSTKEGRRRRRPRTTLLGDRRGLILRFPQIPA